MKKNRGKKGPVLLFRGFVGDEKLASYMWIIVSRDTDPVNYSVSPLEQWKKPGWLGYIRDYTKAWNKDPCLNSQDSMKSKGVSLPWRSRGRTVVSVVATSPDAPFAFRPERKAGGFWMSATRMSPFSPLLTISHRIHVNGKIYLLIYQKNQPNAGRYTIYMDGMGYI